MALRIKLLCLLFLLVLPPAASFARTDGGGGTNNGFKVSGTYHFVASTPGGLSGNSFLIYKDEATMRNKNWPIPGFTTWHSTKTEGKEYTCTGLGSLANPVAPVDCTAYGSGGGITPGDGSKDTNPPSGGSTTGGSTSTGSTVPDDSKPLSALLPNSDANSTPPLAQTKDCGPTERYTSGLLKGVVCKGATKDLASVVAIIRNVISMILLPVAGGIFVLMFVAGGVFYITSGGNDQRVALAKKTLTAAIIGLTIVILAFILIKIFASAIGGGVTTT